MSPGRRSGRKEIIVPRGLDGSPMKAQTDDKIVVALARARRCLGLLESREYDSISELAEAIGVGPSYLRRLMTLNFLAPDIVEALLRGDGPDGLTSNPPHLRPMPSGVPRGGRGEDAGGDVSG